MTIDTSYLTKYADQSPLEGRTSTSGTSTSSNLYGIDVGLNTSSSPWENPFGTYPAMNCMDTFNFSPCLGMNFESSFFNSSFAPPSFNFDFGNILNMYNSYMQNIQNSFLQRLNASMNIPPLQAGAYTPAQRVESKSSNDDYIKELQPLMQQKVRMLEAYAKSKGYPFKICSGYRTRDEQVALQKKYANQPGRAAGADSSPHRFGRAIDISTNGLLTESQCADLGRYAKSIGMRWGGDFTTCRERWHFDIPASACA